MNIPDLRSPFDTTAGIVYFPRMTAKIRLHEAGKLPAEYQENLGIGFDKRCCSFLGIEYPALVEQVKAGADDKAAMAWAQEQGTKPREEQIEIWNAFMIKRGWKDEGTPTLERRLRESGLEARADIQTMFAYIDADEGRPVKS